MEEELKTYEIAFLAEDSSKADEILNILNRFKASLISDKKVEKINLAYPIKHQTSAFFGFIDFQVLPRDIVEIDKILKQDKNLLRFMIISDPFIRENKNSENKKAGYSSREKVKHQELTNEALEKKIEEILEK
jgi:ribosomal protein S6